METLSEMAKEMVKGMMSQMVSVMGVEVMGMVYMIMNTSECC
jgi:hypothetical protein